MKITGFHIDKETGIFTSDGGHCEQAPYLEYLLGYDEPYTIRIMSNLDFDVAALLGLLGLAEKELEKLNNNGQLYLAPYTLKYYPGKFFSVDKGFGKGHPWVSFCDASQYDEALGEIKVTSDSSYYQDRANQAQAIGEEAYKAYWELGFNPSTMISPVNVWRKDRIDKLDLPSIADIPLEATEMAYECCLGNWVEAFKLGHFEQAFDYDINSGYPSQALNLLDLRKGIWEPSREYQPEATYGYALCEVMIDSPLCPIFYRGDEGNFSVNGIFERVLTKRQIDFINNRELGYATVLDGQWWYDKGADSILAKEIEWLYQKKQQSTGMAREIVKRIMTGGMYGLFIEVRGGEPGERFVSPWAAEIETGCQLEVARMCLDNKVEPLHIAVDGFIAEKPLPIVSSDKIGEWRLSYQGKCIVLGSGTVAIEGKEGEGDFSLNYDWLIKQLEEHPNKSEYLKVKPTVLSLARAVNENRLADVGKVEFITRTVEIGADPKRYYEQMPENGYDLMSQVYQGQPWEVGMLEVLLGKGNKEGENMEIGG